MDKASLLSELSVKYKSVGTPTLNDSALDTNWYTIPVFEVGNSESNIKPIGHRKNIFFYVWHEGLGDESAYYKQLEPTVDVNSDITAPSADLLEVSKIYASATLRNRTRAACLKAAVDIMNELDTVTDHAKRLKWSGDVLKSPETVVNMMSVFIALDPTVQAGGTSISDSVIQNLINGNIDKTIGPLGY